MTAEQRSAMYLENPVFSFKLDVDKVRHKVIPLAGDVTKPDLGLSEQDQQTLIDNVNVVFHLAGDVKFDVKFRLVIH